MLSETQKKCVLINNTGLQKKKIWMLPWIFQLIITGLVPLITEISLVYPDQVRFCRNFDFCILAKMPFWPLLTLHTILLLTVLLSKSNFGFH